MNEELFDVCDENGNLIGQVANRDDAHKNGLWHRAVVCFFVNDKNEVLLQKRSANKKLWPNMWDISCGGHISSGETIEQATVKEALEEVGIELKENELKLIGAVKSDVRRNDVIDKMHNYYFVVHKNFDANKCKLQLEEVQEIKWVAVTEIERMINEGYKEITDKKGCHEAIVEYVKNNIK